MLPPQKHPLRLVNHCSKQRTSHALACVQFLLELTASLAEGHESLGMLHPNGVWCPDDCGKTIGAVFLLLCLSRELISTADFHLWGLDHYFKRLFKTGKSRHIGKQRQKKTNFQQCLFHVNFTALNSLHLWRSKLAGRGVALPCGKQTEVLALLGPHLEQVAQRATKWE